MGNKCDIPLRNPQCMIPCTFCPAKVRTFKFTNSTSNVGTPARVNPTWTNAQCPEGSHVTQVSATMRTINVPNHSRVIHGIRIKCSDGTSWTVGNTGTTNSIERTPEVADGFNRFDVGVGTIFDSVYAPTNIVISDSSGSSTTNIGDVLTSRTSLTCPNKIMGINAGVTAGPYVTHIGLRCGDLQ